MVTQAGDKTAVILLNKALRKRSWRRSGKSLAVAIVIGLILLVIGILPIATFNGTPFAGPPTCNGQVMDPGDTCDEYDNGALTNSYDYQQMLAQEQPDKGANYGLGFSLIAVALLTLGLGAYFCNPRRPFGKARAEHCPRCGKPELREALMTHSVVRRRVRTTWRSFVVLCTDSCGFATMRKPGQPLTLS